MVHHPHDVRILLIFQGHFEDSLSIFNLQFSGLAFTVKTEKAVLVHLGHVNGNVEGPNDARVTNEQNLLLACTLHHCCIRWHTRLAGST